MTSAFVDEGLSPRRRRHRLWFVDVNGLVVKGRTDLMPHNLPYAHDHAPLGFVEAIDAIKPHVLIGATGAPGHVHAAGRRAHVRAQHAAGPVRAVQSHVARRMHGRAGLYVERRPGRLHQRQSVRPRDATTGASSGPARATTPTSSPASDWARSRAAPRSIPDEFFLAAARTLARMVTDERPRAGFAVPAAARHSQDLAGDRGQRGRNRPMR